MTFLEHIDTDTVDTVYTVYIVYIVDIVGICKFSFPFVSLMIPSDRNVTFTFLGAQLADHGGLCQLAVPAGGMAAGAAGPLNAMCKSHVSSAELLQQWMMMLGIHMG